MFPYTQNAVRFWKQKGKKGTRQSRSATVSRPEFPTSMLCTVLYQTITEPVRMKILEGLISRKQQRILKYENRLWDLRIKCDLWFDHLRGPWRVADHFCALTGPNNAWEKKLGPQGALRHMAGFLPK